MSKQQTRINQGIKVSECPEDRKEKQKQEELKKQKYLIPNSSLFINPF